MRADMIYHNSAGVWYLEAVSMRAVPHRSPGRFSFIRQVASGVVALAVAGSPAAAEPDVVVTSKPIHSLASALLRGVGDPPHLLIQGQASPHSYALKPSDARAVARARLFVRTSAQLEPFTAKLMASLPASVGVLTLADAAGVKQLPVRGAGVFGDDHDHHGGGSGHEEPKDPHVWLDPANAAAMGEALVVSLRRLFPAAAAGITANGAALKAELAALEGEIGRLLEPVRGRKYLSVHDAYQYLDSRFGIVSAGAVAAIPEAQAGAKRLSALRALVTQAGVGCIIAEPAGDMRLVSSLAEGSKARLVTLDPEALRLSPGPALYGVLMRGLARDFAACLADPR